MVQVPWFGPYTGYYTQADLTDENFRWSLMATHDEFVEQVRRASRLLGTDAGGLTSATEIEAAHGFEALRQTPLCRICDRIWHVARDGIDPADDLQALVDACFEFLDRYIPVSDGPLIVSEVHDDYPLLYAWVMACECLWERGLRAKLTRGRWWIEYVQSGIRKHDTAHPSEQSS